MITGRLLHASPRSPFGRQVRIVLAEKGLDFQTDQTLALQRPAKDFGRLSPALRVPVLEDNGRVFFDTRIIIEYLLVAYPDMSPGAPEPPLCTALTRPEHHFDDAMVLSTLNAALDAAVNLNQLRRNNITPDDAPYLQRQQERIAASLDWLEGASTPEGFQPGVFSIADIALITMLDFGEEQELFAFGTRTGLKAIRDRFSGRPSVTATKPADPGP